MKLKDAFEDVQQYQKLCNFLFIRDKTKCIRLVTTIPLQAFSEEETVFGGSYQYHNLGTINSIMKKKY